MTWNRRRGQIKHTLYVSYLNGWITKSAFKEMLEDLNTVEPNSCEYWDSKIHFCALRRPQAELKHGRWIEVSNSKGWIRAICSNCGEPKNYRANKEPLICPHCGADMREVEE